MNAALILTDYGSLEIKRAFQKNMAIGMFTAAILVLAIALAALIYSNYKPAVIELPPKPPEPIDISTWQPPPIVRIEQPRNNPNTAKPILNAGIPTPVPDEDAPDNATIPTTDEWDILANSHIPDSLGDLDPNSIFVANPDEILPDPGIFVPVDELPQVIETIQPIYPEMARQAGVQGDVWLNVYIDKEGHVRSVTILKASGASAGFEEAAIIAANATSWKPAISNGQPVSVWISYKISFRLK